MHEHQMGGKDATPEPPEEKMMNGFTSGASKEQQHLNWNFNVPSTLSLLSLTSLLPSLPIRIPIPVSSVKGLLPCHANGAKLKKLPANHSGSPVGEKDEKESEEKEVDTL